MSWVAVGVAAVGAVGGAVSANQSAKAANKPRNSSTDQYTVQNPYGHQIFEPDINAIVQYQRGLVAQGVPQVGANGQVTYGQQLPWGYEGGDARNAAANSGGGGGGPVVPPGGSRRPDGRILDAKGKTIYTPPAPAGGGGGTKAGGGSGGGGKNAAGGKTTTAPGAGTNYSNPTSIYGTIAERGLNAGNTQTQTQARTAMGNILGAAGAGTGGSAAAGEQTGFEGYNPILDRYAQRLETDMGERTGRDLLLGFLNENNRGGGTNTNGGGGAGGNGNDRRVNLGTVSRAYTSGGDYATGNGPAPTRPQSGVPDTMVPESYFGTQVRQMMDEKANEEELASLIAAMNADTEKGMYRDLAQLDAASQGSGRFGGDMWKGLSGDAREEALQEMLKTSSGVRLTDAEQRRQMRQNLLGQVNTRDLGLLNANVQREGISASERNAAAAASASMAGSADQLALAKRGQDLSALGALMDYEQYGMGQLGQVGGQLSSDRLATLGMVPGLEGIGLNGLNAALGAAGGMVDMRGQDIQRGIANQQAGIARQGMNQQLGMYNANQQQQLLNNYLGTLQNIGSMGGSSHTYGNNVIPGAGISTSGAALTGALGGAAAGAGIYGQMRYGG